MPHRTHLQQRVELGAADRAVVGLVAEIVSTAITETQVSARQDQSVTRLTHTDDTLRPVVINVVDVMLQHVIE